jgi:serine/threonine protein kinase
MRLHTRTTFVASEPALPSWHAAADFAARRRADSEFTLGLDEEWEDVPTAQLDAPSYDEPTANVEPPVADAIAERVEPPARVTPKAASPATPAPERPAARAQPANASIAARAERSPPPAASVQAESPRKAAEPATPPPSSPPPASVLPRDVTTGTLLCNRYVLGRLLGAGGSSLIFQAEDRRRVGAEDFGNRIAIKVLRQEMRNNPHALTRLRREFRQMQRLTHPGIARVYELASDDDIWFMTMELIEGQTLNQWLKTNTNRAAGLKVIGACCDALHHAHEAGVVHGDLKPSNVLVLGSGGVKLVDFGSAAERDASMGIIDKERSFAATPPYASPQVLAGEVADPRDDVFSLACLTYGVLTNGEHPFERKSSAEAQQAQMRPAYARGISPRQFEVIVRALAWDREQRPANVREFMHALLASDLRRDPPTLAAADEAKPATAVKPEDVARLKAAVAAAETHAEQIKASQQEKPEPPKAGKEAKGDPLERFKGYVAGPHAPGAEEERQRHPQNAVDAPEPQRKKKWTWPWQRSALFGLVLLTGAAIVATRFDFNTEPIRQAEAHVAHPAPPPAPVAQPPAASQPETIAPQVEEKKSPPVALKAKPTPAVAPGEVSFTTRTLQVGANQTVAALAVKRLNSTRGRAKVAWKIEGGTARRGVHYEVPDSQLIEFLDGQSVRSLFITLMPEKDTAGARHSKTFTVKLQQSNGGPALGEIKQVHVTIVGDVADAGGTVGS